MNCLATRFCLWLVTLAVFPIPPSVIPQSFRVEVIQPYVDCGALPQERRLDLTDRVLVRLVDAESKETDALYRDDIRISRLTMGLARKGSPIPHIEATYYVLGCHPCEVWPRIVARRHAVLGAEYEAFFGADVSPRKPVASERRRVNRDVGNEEAAA